MDFEACKDILLSFLNEPLSESDGIFKRFSELPGAMYRKGEKPNQRFLFVPGKKKNRVLLVAHTDTVWDKNYKGCDFPANYTVKDNDVVSSGEKAGIGADDRAGCAALWLLRDSGHSLLLIDGEERSHIGGSYIFRNRKYMKLFNSHAYVMALDLSGTDGYMFHAVKNPKSFADFIDSVGYKRQKENGGSDIFYICRKAAGVNVSIGYFNEHKQSETISFDAFYNCLNRASRLLEKTDRKFRIPFFVRTYQNIKHRIALIIKPIFKKLKK